MKKGDFVDKAAYFAAEAQSIVTASAIAEAESFANIRATADSDPEEWQAEFESYMQIAPAPIAGTVTIYLRGKEIAGAHVSFNRAQLTVAATRVDSKGGHYFTFEECHHGHARAKFFDTVIGCRAFVYYKNDYSPNNRRR